MNYLNLGKFMVGSGTFLLKQFAFPDDLSQQPLCARFSSSRQ